jgi:hypothetical protein
LLLVALSARSQDATTRIVEPAAAGNEHPITLRLVSLAAAPSLPQPAGDRANGTPRTEAQDFNVVVLPTPALEEGQSVSPPRVLLPGRNGGSGTRPTSHQEGDGGQQSPGEATGGRALGCLRVPGPVQSVVYVIDCSMSMGGPDERSHKFARARRELLDSLQQLSDNTRFQVIPYNHTATPLLLEGQSRLIRKSARSVQATAEALAQRKPTGWTDHGQALHRGLALRPEVLFFVTDGDDLKPAQERDATRFNQGQTVIHVIALRPRSAAADCPLQALARNNRGSYRYVSLQH